MQEARPLPADVADDYISMMKQGYLNSAGVAESSRQTACDIFENSQLFKDLIGRIKHELLIQFEQLQGERGYSLAIRFADSV